MPLGTYRKQIDAIDKQLLELFEKRMDLATKVAEYKQQHQLPVLNEQREQEVLKQQAAAARPEYAPYATDFFTEIMRISRELQQTLLD